MLARHGRRILNLLDDTPVVPGDTRPAFEHAAQARQVLNDAEEDLREWTPKIYNVTSSAKNMTSNLMPIQAGSTATASEAGDAATSTTQESTIEGVESPTRRDTSGSSTVAQPSA